MKAFLAGFLFWERWKPPSLTPVVMCCNSSTCPLARCFLCCATRAPHSYPVKPDLRLQPYALPCPLGYFNPAVTASAKTIPKSIELELRQCVRVCLCECAWVSGCRCVSGKSAFKKTDEKRKAGHWVKLSFHNARLCSTKHVIIWHWLHDNKSSRGRQKQQLSCWVLQCSRKNMFFGRAKL